ncbi:MMPL family transporter [Magnetococcus sp. PR-3]|uniref:MMPL family transporter n=1 Tax=Magnetococcus sp. PR-3 TaxID=3120355 RepID=UPI002FCE3FFB
MLQTLFLFSLRHRLATLIIISILTAVALSGIGKLRVDASQSSLFDPNDPAKSYYDQVVDTFGSDLATQVYIKDAKLFTPEKLILLEELHVALEQLPFVEKVESLLTVANVRNVDGDLDTTPLMDYVPENAEEIERIQRYARDNPFVMKNLLAEDMRTTVISVRIRNSFDDDTLVDRAYDQVEAIVEPVRDKFDTIFQIGTPRINAGTKRGIRHDMHLLTPISGLIIIIGISLFLGSIRVAVLPLITAGFSIVWCMGFLGLMDVPLNLISSGLPLLLIAVGSTEDTHMVGAYYHGLHQTDLTGKKPHEIRAFGVQSMMKKIGIATLVTAGTTAIGFGSSIFSNIKILQDFGIATSLGMICNLFATMLVVPLYLRHFGPLEKKDNKEEKKQSRLFRHVLVMATRLSEHHAKSVLSVAALVAIIGIGMGSTLQGNNDPLSYLKSDDPVVVDAQRMHQDIAGIQMFYLTLDGKQSGAFLKPENMQLIQSIQNMLKASGYFDNVLSIADHISYVNREITSGKSIDYSIPNDAALIEQYMLFFQRGDMSQFIDSEMQQAALVVRHNISNSIILEEVISDISAKIETLSQGRFAFRIISENILVNRTSDALVTEQIKSFMIVVLVIFVLISFMYSSVALGAVSLIPNVLPAFVIFGVMAIFDISLNPGTVLVTVVALGIAVDDTIHLLTGYSLASKGEPSPSHAVRTALTSQVVAVLTTSVSLCVSFLIFGFSNFQVVADFGILCAVGLATAALADLFVTPIFLRKVRLVTIWDIISLKIGSTALKESPLFQGMTRYQIRKTILLSHMHRVKKGEYIIRQGEQGEDMFVLLSGQTDVMIIKDGHETPVTELQPGAIFGEMGYTGLTLRTANIVAREDSVLIQFNAKQIDHALKLYPHIARKFYRNLANIMALRFEEMCVRMEGRDLDI